MQTSLIFLYILIAISLIILILLQQGKGSDIGSAFGGGASNAMFGPNSSLSPLTKITAILATLFLIFSLAITYQARSSTKALFLEQETTRPVERGELPDTIPE
ncbi:MAG: preprotein translocase subunit SecG [Gammaproteobacteria bacterium]|nr:preprotein translocase subunit SecG [Gammaproteobacteria bacterium]|tara:strand:- start:905 stop:1213 length:309 start_codon:yes stop_codon:yes gene_type:complete